LKTVPTHEDERCPRPYQGEARSIASRRSFDFAQDDGKMRKEAEKDQSRPSQTSQNGGIAILRVQGFALPLTAEVI